MQKDAVCFRNEEGFFFLSSSTAAVPTLLSLLKKGGSLGNVKQRFSSTKGARDATLFCLMKSLLGELHVVFSLLYSASLTASFLEAASPVFFLFPQISLFSSSCDKGVTKQSASKWGRHGTREEMSSRLLMPQPNHESETHINPSFS